MSKTVEKIRVESATDEEIVEECKKKIHCSDCEPIEWSIPPKGSPLSPPERTIAVVVDVVRNRGAIRIFAKESGDYLGGVGTEEEGYRILIPWRDDWRFRASGVVDVGYIRTRNVN